MENDFRYIDVNRFRSGGRGRSIPMGAARLHYVTKENTTFKNPYYCITFNSFIYKEIRDKGCMHLRLRENVLTGELYFVFVRDNTPDSIKVPIGRGENKCISVFNKGLVDFLMKSLNIKREEAPDYLLDIGDNKSRMENAVVLQISKK